MITGVGLTVLHHVETSHKKQSVCNNRSWLLCLKGTNDIHVPFESKRGRWRWGSGKESVARSSFLLPAR